MRTRIAQLTRPDRFVACELSVYGTNTCCVLVFSTPTKSTFYTQPYQDTCRAFRLTTLRANDVRNHAYVPLPLPERPARESAIVSIDHHVTRHAS